MNELKIESIEERMDIRLNRIEEMKFKLKHYFMKDYRILIKMHYRLLWISYKQKRRDKKINKILK